jgi:thiolase-like protein
MARAAAPGSGAAPTSLAGQFEQPYGPLGRPTLFCHEQLAMVSFVQREWAAKNPRPTFKTPITVEDVLNSRMIACPFRLLRCCLVTDGGALILVAAERARDFPQSLPLAVNRGPVYLLGTGESVETPMVSQMEDFTSSRAVRVAGPKAFAEAGITHSDVDHLMIYDAPCSLPGAGFAHLPIYGLEISALCRAARPTPSSPSAEPPPGTARRAGRPGIPLNTNGDGLSYMRSGMYGMYALQESVRQMRDTAPAQFPRRQDLGLPRRRRHVRRLRYDHHVKRGGVIRAWAVRLEIGSKAEILLNLRQ